MKRVNENLKLTKNQMELCDEPVLVVTENNQYYKITDGEETAIVPKYIVFRGLVFKVLFSDELEDGYNYKFGLLDGKITFNTRMRSIRLFQSTLIESIVCVLYTSLDLAKVPESLARQLFRPLSMTLGKLLEENHVAFKYNYNKFRDMLFEIPDSIRVLGTEYEIVGCDNLGCDADDSILGLYVNQFCERKCIYIASTCEEVELSESAKCVTFIHELFHAILFETGNSMYEKNANREEVIVDYFAYSICELLRSNDLELVFGYTK